MDWALPVGLIALLLLACPLMMVGRMVFGWLFGRRLMSQGSGSGHGGHGMMMCMGHGQGHGKGDTRHDSAPDLVEELKAERERLDELIARAEGNR